VSLPPPPLFDLVILGSGPGGYRAAVLAAQRGLRVAVIEEGIWGGCCLNRGCVPKRAWHETARSVDLTDAAQRGIQGKLTVDFVVAWQHQRHIVERVRDSYLSFLDRLGVERIEGRGRIAAPGAVVVDDRRINATHILIATGSHPHLPQGWPSDNPRILTTNDLFDTLPPHRGHWALIGGGIVAVELAYILPLLGIGVTWLCRSTPLKHIPEVVRTPVLQALARRGIAPRIAPIPTPEIDNDAVRIGGECFDAVLVATGRTPNTSDLGLEHLDLEAHGPISVNERCQTAAPGVWAIGDCTPGPMTANRAMREALTVVDAITGAATPTKGWRNQIPTAIYSATEGAFFGPEDEALEDAGFEPAVGFVAFDVLPQALAQGQAHGFARLVADMDSGEVLAGQVVGEQAGELIQMLSTLPPGQALRFLAQSAVNHPSLSEIWSEVAIGMGKQWGLNPQLWGETAPD